MCSMHCTLHLKRGLSEVAEKLWNAHFWMHENEFFPVAVNLRAICSVVFAAELILHTHRVHLKIRPVESDATFSTFSFTHMQMAHNFSTCVFCVCERARTFSLHKPMMLCAGKWVKVLLLNSL